MEDYRLPEIESETPSFLFAPTINNDGRRLFAGSRSYAVLTKPSKGTKGAILESIDMQSYLAEAEPGQSQIEFHHSRECNLPLCISQCEFANQS